VLAINGTNGYKVSSRREVRRTAATGAGEVCGTGANVLGQAEHDGILQTSDEESFGQWIEWAEWYADHIDPLVRAAPRPAVVETPENKPLHELDLTSRARPVLAALGVVDCDALSKVTEKQIREVQERYSHLIWSEICRVLEGHGYKVSKRQYW
jgi:hypothetical protein